MASVFTFWHLPVDEISLFALLEKGEALVGYQSAAASSADQIRPQSLSALLVLPEVTQIDILPASFLDKVVIEARAGGYGVSSQKSPVISYRRGLVRAGVLGMSNLAMYKNYPAEDASTMILKDADYLTWARRIFAAVKKAAPEKLLLNGHPYAATTRVKKAVDAGEITLGF